MGYLTQPTHQEGEFLPIKSSEEESWHSKPTKEVKTTTHRRLNATQGFVLLVLPRPRGFGVHRLIFSLLVF